MGWGCFKFYVRYLAVADSQCSRYEVQLVKLCCSYYYYCEMAAAAAMLIKTVVMLMKMLMMKLHAFTHPLTPYYRPPTVAVLPASELFGQHQNTFRSRAGAP